MSSAWRNAVGNNRSSSHWSHVPGACWGVQAHHRGRTAEARAILDRITEEYEDVHLRATRGLLLLKEGNVKEGTRPYNEALKRATGRELRAVLIQKKNLELAKIALKNDRPDQAKALLLKVLAEENTDRLCTGQAKRLLESIRCSMSRL